MSRGSPVARRAAWAALALGLGSFAACADSNGPELDSVVPAAAARNSTVLLTGKRLCGPAGDCATAGGEIDLGIQPPMTRAIIVSYSDTAAMIEIPPGVAPGQTAIIATVGDESSNQLPFQITQ